MFICKTGKGDESHETEEGTWNDHYAVEHPRSCILLRHLVPTLYNRDKPTAPTRPVRSDRRRTYIITYVALNDAGAARLQLIMHIMRIINYVLYLVRVSLDDEYAHDPVSHVRAHWTL